MSHRPSRAHVRRLALGLSLALLAASLAVPAIAEDVVEGKLYTATVTPDVCVAAGVAEDFTVTLTNTSTTPQQLGSANIDIPATFSVPPSAKLTLELEPRPRLKRNDPKPTVELVENQLQLRNLSAGPGVAISVTFTAAPSLASTHAFVTAAKQANDFNGDGNDLTLVGGDPVVTVGSCSLEFLTQPGDTSVDVPIPGADGRYGPRVAIVDGERVVITRASASITIALTPSGSLSGTVTEETVDGVATFGALKVRQAGTYRLTASAAGFGDDVSSEDFEVFAFGDTCDDGDVCTTTIPGAGGSTSLSGTAGGGTGSLLGSSEPKNDQVEACGAVDEDGKPVDYEIDDYSYLPSQVTMGGTNLEDKRAQFRVSKEFDQQQTNNGVSFYQVCATRLAPFNQSSIFVDIFGNTVANPEDTVNLKRLGLDPDDVGVTFQTSGFLPDCTSADDSPCVESRVKRGGGPVITVRWGSRWRMR